MAPSTPIGPPASAVAGDTWTWKVADLADYPQAEGWSFAYRLLPTGATLATPVDITPAFQSAGDDAGHWLATVPAASTEALTAGAYRLVGRVTGSGAWAGRVQTVCDDLLRVEPNPTNATATASEFQSHEARVVAALEASIEGGVSDDRLIEQYGIAGRTVAKMAIERRVTLLRRYRDAVRQRQTGRLGRSVEIQFGRA